MRLLPIAIVASLLSVPLQVELVVRESTAMAENAEATPPPATAATATASGFGSHARPWATDLLSDQPNGDVEDTDPTAMTPQQACLASDEAAQTRLTQLRAAEVRLAKQREALLDLEGRITALLERQALAQQRDVQQLVALYRNMKPTEAAAIFTDLDMSLVVSIIMSMKEREAAPILAQMPKLAAQEITRAIAERQSLDALEVSRL